MAVGTANHGGYPLYRCPPTGDCTRRVTVSAELVEGIVSDAVREALADAEGRASAESSVRNAECAVERAQGDLDAAIQAFAGLDREQTAVERLGELRDARNAAQERLDQLGGQRAAVVVTIAADWDRLSIDERRALIRATVERVTVAPGRGASRVSVKLVGQ
jgi:PHD/YefM family antitoxin component YafN of YafNO toxin-antitoxin module